MDLISQIGKRNQRFAKRHRHVRISQIGKRNQRFAKRHRHVRKYAMPLGEDVLGMVDPGAMVKSVDKSKASARFVISTKGEDRDGDIVIPSGCQKHLATYEANPVVFWDHQNHPYPIALSEYPAGGCTVEVERDRVTGEAFFHQKTKESSEICELVMEGILRCASVGFRPIQAKKRHGPGEGHVFEEWELTEWSIVALGANADALRLRLDGNKIKSVRLRNNLEPYAARVSKSWSQGVTLMEKTLTLKQMNKMFDSGKEEDDLEDDTQDEMDETKADGPPWEDDDEDEDEDDDGYTIEKDETEDTPEETGETDISEEAPVEDAEPDPATDPMPGALTMASMAHHFQGELDYCQQALRSNENEQVRAFLERRIEAAQAAMDEAASLVESVYPDHDFEDLKSQAAADMMPEDKGDSMNTMTGSEGGMLVDEEEPEEVMKRYKRLNKAGRSCIKDAAEYLDDLAGQGDIPKRYSAGCKYHGKSLNDLVSGMEQTDSAEEEPTDETQVAKRLDRRMNKVLRMFTA